jgi:hypothetical protein
MKKTAVYLALFGILASGAGLALADEMPADMTMIPDIKAPADPGSSEHSLMQARHRGGREGHHRMISGQRMSMHNMPQSGMAAMGHAEAMPMQSGSGC